MLFPALAFRYVQCCRFYIILHDDMKSSDSGGSHPKEKTEAVSGLLEKSIAAPLVRVQTALAKETVLWKRGILVMPKVIHLSPCFEAQQSRSQSQGELQRIP